MGRDPSQHCSALQSLAGFTSTCPPCLAHESQRSPLPQMQHTLQATTMRKFLGCQLTSLWPPLVTKPETTRLASATMRVHTS